MAGLNISEKNHLALLGIRDVRVIGMRNMDWLLEGTNDAGDPVRGWYKIGEGIPDIVWHKKGPDGWPENVEKGGRL